MAQRLLPEAVATASAIFMSSPAIASALGGLTGGAGVSILGLPLMFLAPAFFGLVATCGTTFVMVETVTAASWWCGAVMGLLAVAILEANNIRDIGTDEAAGKRTLAVRLGEPHARALFGTMVVGAFGTIVAGVLAHLLDASVGMTQWGLVGLAAWPLAIQPLEAARIASGRDLIPVLVGTAKLHAATGLLLSLGLLLSHTV